LFFSGTKETPKAYEQHTARKIQRMESN
jgi:hypothetical protein